MTRKLGRPELFMDQGRFRFSRIYPHVHRITPLREEMLVQLGQAMAQSDGSDPGGDDPHVPAGYTYLGQFVDHDLSLDKTRSVFGAEISVPELIQGRSPVLDLDSLYGQGPEEQPEFYSDGRRLKTGKTVAVTFPSGQPKVEVELEGFDLPRRGEAADKAARRSANIPDDRNDENLAVAQLHAAFIRFHNRVVDRMSDHGSAVPFERARAEVVKHYQWMLRHDYLPRIIDNEILEDVFQNGRRFFEADEAATLGPGTMPIEFSVAAFRLGHSMIAAKYEWNAVFQTGGPGGPASLAQLFNFSGKSGTLSPPGADFERLPTNWVADWRRMFELGGGLAVAAEFRNRSRRINTLLVDPLQHLPAETIVPLTAPLPRDLQMNLAVRNLIRGRMVKLPSGQQMAEFLNVQHPLSAQQILEGRVGVSGVPVRLVFNREEQGEFVGATPLWFYILREAEINFGRLGPVGSRIVAETFHRAMEISTSSIVRDRSWRPWLTTRASFTAADLLIYAFEGNRNLLAPLG